MSHVSWTCSSIHGYTANIMHLVLCMQFYIILSRLMLLNYHLNVWLLYHLENMILVYGTNLFCTKNVYPAHYSVSLSCLSKSVSKEQLLSTSIWWIMRCTYILTNPYQKGYYQAIMHNKSIHVLYTSLRQKQFLLVKLMLVQI